MPIETWSPVPSALGVLASSEGRVMNEPYIGVMHTGAERIYGGIPTKGRWDGARYSWFVKRLGKTFKVHRLVCEAFNGPSLPGQVCMHLNEDASDNRPENLAWGTQKQNLNAPGFIAYCRDRTGDKSPVKKHMATNGISSWGSHVQNKNI